MALKLTLEEFSQKARDNVRIKESKKVLSCPFCKGAGFDEREELINYHKRDYGTFYDICKTCNGEGKVIEHKYEASIGYSYEKEVNISPCTKDEMIQIMNAKERK